MIASPHPEGCLCERCLSKAFEAAEILQGDGQSCTGSTYCICPACRGEDEAIAERVRREESTAESFETWMRRAMRGERRAS